MHTGGGLVLLCALLAEWPDGRPLTAFLDVRARAGLVLPQGTNVWWVTASIHSRLNAEFRLRKTACAGSTVLCFHGLPPLLPNAARVLVFLQNRLYLKADRLSQFKWKTRLRLACERFVSRVFRHRVSEYLVQTPSMQRAVMQWYGSQAPDHGPAVRVLPFLDVYPKSSRDTEIRSEWDFLYVADGEAHKNHRVLLSAWRVLAQEGIRPSLALTLSQRDEALRREVELARDREGLKIHDLGQIPRIDVLALYLKSRALIFPSTSESFGLPLVEATRAGLPILASELDYVRDVCVPVQTFDPASPVSIARAVRRFLGCPEPNVTMRTPSEFWDELLQKDHA